MKGSLRIMHFGFLITVIVTVLIVAKTVDASAKHTGVKCPCDFFESVPLTTACWNELPFISNPEYFDDPEAQEACFVMNINVIQQAFLQMVVGPASEQRPEAICQIQSLRVGNGCTVTPAEEVDITPEQVKACQCELLAYVTALNEVAGISVSPGPPYECFDVDCTPTPIITTPIPTLNEWGMIAMVGILGIIGFMVIRRRKLMA